MKHSLRIFTTYVVLLFAFSVNAQTSPITVVFEEKFDPPSGPDSVTTFHTTSGTNIPYWNDTSAFSISAPNSYHSKIVPFDSVIFQTDTFSTVGNVFVSLSFAQICKIHFGQQAYVRVSNNNGASWTRLNGSHYSGLSPAFGSAGYFNELSYANPNATPYWGGLTTAGTGTAPSQSWWTGETFDISSVIGNGPGGTANGYSNCIIQFILEYRSPFGTADPAGWFVDNLKVVAAPCELVPPTLTFNLNPRREPIGPRYQSNQEVRLKATDLGSGIDSVLLFHRLNGGPWDTIQMSSSMSSACPDSAEYFHTITNLIVSDSVDWFVEVHDCACPNTVRSPSLNSSSQYNTFWIDPSPPAICGVTTSNSFPYLVTNFPWVEDFSSIDWIQGSGVGGTGTSHRGIFPQGNPPSGKNWQVSPNTSSTGFAWSVRLGQTGTPNTGPTGDHTTGSGKYIYTEASQGNTNNNTTVITPCIKLTGLNHAVLEFWYHKYGQHMGNMRVDIDTGSASPSWVNAIALIPGQVQTAQIQPWEKVVVNLDPYLGKIIRIRFLGNKNNSSSNDRGDMALDDISIYEPDPADIEMVAVYKPQNGFCQYTSNEDIRVHIRSEGFFPIDTIALAYSLTNLSTNSTVIFRDTVYQSLGLGDTLSYTFSPKADLSAFANYNIYAWSEASGDPNTSNDSIGPIFIEHKTPINQFPHIQDFDGAGWSPGNGTSSNPGTFNTSDWEALPASNSSNYAFMIGSDLTSTFTTGPRWSKGRKGNYLYAEGSYGSNGPAALFATTKCVDLSAQTNPVLTFWYHMYGSDINTLNVQVIPNGSNTWQTVTGAPITNQQQSKEVDDWKFKMVDLSAYAGNVINIRILARKSGSGSMADIAIDDLYIYDRPTSDVGVSKITSPLNSVNLLNPQNVIFKVYNYGTAAKSNIPITYTIQDLCTPANFGTYNTTYTGTLAPGAQTTITIPTPPTYFNGDFEVKAWTTLTGDGLALNDTASKISSGATSYQIAFGPVDFDNCIGDEFSFFAQGGTGTMQMWEFGTPSKGTGWNSAASGANCWITGLKDDYQPGMTEILRIPTLTEFDTTVAAELRFKHKFDFAPADGGAIEYFQNGSWNTLGNASMSVGYNWYGSSFGSAAVPSLNSPGWLGNSGGQWIISSIPLSVWDYSINPIQLRARMVSSAGSSAKGWAIDDFEVYVPPQNSASPVEIETFEYLIIPSDTSHLRVRIQNTGAKLLDSCKVRYKVDGGPWTNFETVVFKNKSGGTAPMMRGQQQWYNLQEVWVNNGAGAYNICMQTSRPNAKGDNILSDDTLCLSFTTLDIINIDLPNPYCNDFENSSIASWLPLHPSVKTLQHDWELGTPNQTSIIGASSGTNAWMTRLDSNYNHMGQSALHTPFFILDTFKVYSMSFDHNMVTELYHDGGNVDWSYDGGITWYTLGSKLTNGLWYNTTNVSSLDIIRPGWTGTTSGYITSTIKFTVDKPGSLVFRFRFGSDYTLHEQGWAIDDFCLEEMPAGTPADIVGIGIPELEIPGFSMGHISPNPISGEGFINFNASRPLSVEITISNKSGQTIFEKGIIGDEGYNKVLINASEWSSGLYFMKATVDGNSITRKFIVQH
ncbi:MAG: Uncharacterised protein [Owenweeksia sp. TMED14]|nr:MAG: Uncharacterised protein [Owenweeksia sp. TMED14]